MALYLNLPTSPVGIPVPEAYCRLRLFQETGDKQYVHCVFDVYYSQAAYQAAAYPLTSHQCQVPVGVLLVEGNPRSVLYGWVKENDPFFAGATQDAN